MSYSSDHLNEAVAILNRIDTKAIEHLASVIQQVKSSKGRLFFLGVGGSAANCSHAVNDFRKIANIEAYAPTDNVSELTARTNDEGWRTVFSEWLKVSNLTSGDCLFVMSVGGGDAENNVSANIVEAIDYAKSVNASVVGIVGREGGYTAKNANACVIIPTVNSQTITPHTEAFQAVVWHLLVSHPVIKERATKWETVGK